ncbi:hypothetical protein GF327_03895 [Candidatus Woesearchaeota archaeon]|nr:hypothetical protein [Candidatus Woesearchaeota archaeon]
MKKNKLLLGVFVFFILASFSHAISSPYPGGTWKFSVSFISDTFKLLFQLLTNDYVVYGITVILYFILFYGIFAATAGRLKIFGSGGKLNKSGKLVCIALCGLSVIAIFYYSNGNVRGTLEQTLQPFGAFGGVILALVLWGTVFFGMRGLDSSKKWRYSLAIAGFGLWIVGAIMGKNFHWMVNLGALIVLIGFIFGGGFGAIVDRRIAQQTAAAVNGATPSSGYTHVHGMVRGGGGGPVPGANIFFRKKRRLWKDPVYKITSQNTGNYEINLPQGEYRVQAVAPNGVNKSPERVIYISGNDFPHDFTIPGIAGGPTAYPGNRIPIGGGRHAQPWYDANTGAIVRVDIN